MQDVNQEILGEFKAEADERSAAIQQYVQRMKLHGCRPDLIQRVAHQLHTLKGAAGFLHYDDVVSGLHHAEELLYELRHEGAVSEQAAIEAVERTIASLRYRISTNDAAGEHPETNAYSPALPATPDSCIRVDRQRLRELQALSGCLDRSMESLRKAIDHETCECRGTAQATRSIRRVQHALRESLGHAHRLARAIVHAQCRPFGFLVPRYDQLVLQLCSATGNQMDLQVSGLGVEVHESIILTLDSVISHLLRNSAVHGIEGPDERVKAGKTEHGIVSLSVVRQGCRLELEYADDGRGLNLDAVARQAVRMGFVTKEQLAPMPLIDRGNLAFEPGLSTSTKTTNLVGRGLGLSAVRSEVTALQGDVTWLPGGSPRTGFRLRIRLPVAQVVDRCLLCRSAGVLFALSAGNVLMSADQESDGLTTHENLGQYSLVIDQGPSGDSCMAPELFPVPSEREADPVSRVIVTDCIHRRPFVLVPDQVIGTRELVVTSQVNEDAVPADWICGYARISADRFCPVLDTGWLSAASTRLDPTTR